MVITYPKARVAVVIFQKGRLEGMPGFARRQMAIFVLAGLALPAQHRAPLGLGQVVILIGPPGSGKTTQAESLSRKYRIPVISLPQLMQAKKGKQKPDPLQSAIASGELLGDQAAIDMIRARANQADAGRGFILDGFPATEVQAKNLDGFVAQQGLESPKVVVLEATDEVVRERLLKRKRANDSAANIERRLKEYHAEEAFLNGWYKSENTVRVPADQPAPQVLAAIEAGLIELFDKKGFKSRSAPAR